MNLTPNTAENRTPTWLEALAVALLLALICVLAWPGMNAPLLLDDLDQMAHVKGFRSWQDCLGGDCYRLLRPIKNLIFFGGADLGLFKWHALNLAIHLSAIPLVYLFLRRLFGAPVWAFAAVTLWATCPTQASTALWMSCANISLAIGFTCACVYFHDHSRDQPGRNVGPTVLAGLCLFLAQISYETAVAVPALCVLVDALRRRPLFSRAAIVRYAMLALLTLLYLVIRSHAGAVFSGSRTNPLFAPGSENWQLSLSAPWFLWRHFSMWLMPAGRLEFCGTYVWGLSAAPWELAAAWAWLLGIGGLSLYTWRRQPWVSFGLLWFLISSFPASNFVPIRSGPIADYYLVIPGVGLAIALTGCAKALVDWIHRERLNPDSQRKLIGGALLGFVVLWRVLCIPLFWLQAGLWCRPLELYLRCGLTRPAQYRLQALAARELLLTGQLPQAKAYALESYETGPGHGMNSMVLGSIALETADYDEAEKRFREALANAPEQSPVHDYSQLHLAKTFMAQKSKRHLVRETLLPLLNRPRSTSHLAAINLQIDCYLAQDKPNEARRAAAKAAQIHPDNPQLNQRLKALEKDFPSSAELPQPQR